MIHCISIWRKLVELADWKIRRSSVIFTDDIDDEFPSLTSAVMAAAAFVRRRLAAGRRRE
jgi:hypothetical protein